MAAKAGIAGLPLAQYQRLASNFTILRYRSQGVSHLRSPTFVHPHASRLIDDAVLAFAASRSRLHELHPLPEATPPNAPRAWNSPSATLFDDFCAAALAELHDSEPTLMDRLFHARVADIVPLSGGGCELLLEHVVATASGLASATSLPTTILARRVVLAVGDSFAPRLPEAWAAVGAPPGRVVHAAELASRFPAAAMEPNSPHALSLHASAHALVTRALLALLQLVCTLLLFVLPPSRPLASRVHRAWHLASARPRWRTVSAAPTDPPAECSARRLLIVGCGLSGVQLAAEARRRGWRHVTLLSRAPIAVRPFDISDEWVQRHLSWELQPCESAFFGADSHAERRAILARARPGGSITKTAHEALLRAAAEATPHLDVREGSVVARAEWCAHAGELVVHLRTAACAAGKSVHEGEGGRETSVRADAAWLATGHRLDAALVAPLSTLRATRPQPLHDGLPELTPSLRWDEHTDVWVAGGLAALQLGPDALNLAGAGLSAARIVSEWGVGCCG